MIYDLAKTVYAVVFGNYEPPEVLGLYESQTAAEEHADRAGQMARVMPMELILDTLSERSEKVKEFPK